MFFFEKKNQKTFSPMAESVERAKTENFLLLFFKKEALATVLALLLIPTLAALAQPPDRVKRFSVWDIHLGERAAALPDQYVNYACGTNGGPPSVKLSGFVGFTKCKADANGLHEVYFEYDDELEYEARALENRAQIRMYSGTTLFEFPVVASALFDESGIVRGVRAITDARQNVVRDRVEFWELGNFLLQNFGDSGWDCRDLPPEDGEGPAGSKFLKNHCEKVSDNKHLIVEQRFFQKKGQVFIDPQSGRPRPQAFESATRFEMFDVALKLQ